MIKHVVMFKIKDLAEGSNKEENIQKIKSSLEALPTMIHEIKLFEVGINLTNSSFAYDLVLNSAFESEEDLFSYQGHPEHVKVADFVGKVCESRTVVDYIL